MQNYKGYDARMRNAILVAAAFLAPAALAQEKVAIPSGDFSTSPAPLVAHLFTPKGSGPHAAVVMVHGCGGAYARSGKLNARHQMWGDYLAAKGYVALMLDSFTSRGVKELCTQKMAERTLRPLHRSGDAFAALAYVRGMKEVDPGRVSVLGWSHGGSTVLETVDRKPPGGAGFAKAIALYPGCTPKSRKAADFHAHAPLLVLMGEADDWTPVAPCKSLAAATRERGEDVTLVTYPDTYHDFDSPTVQARVRTEVPNGVDKGKGVTVAPNPVAREDAKRRVLEFLRR